MLQELVSCGWVWIWKKENAFVWVFTVHLETETLAPLLQKNVIVASPL